MPSIVALFNCSAPFRLEFETSNTDPADKFTAPFRPSIVPFLNDAPFCAVTVPPFPCRMLSLTCAPSSTSVVLGVKTISEEVPSPEIFPCKVNDDPAPAVWIWPPVLSMFVEIIPVPKINPWFRIKPVPLMVTPPAVLMSCRLPTLVISFCTVTTEPPVRATKFDVGGNEETVPPSVTPSNMELIDCNCPCT